MTEPLEHARFPAVAASAGHYESFYLKLSDLEQPRGAWIRYTVLKRPGEPAIGSVWCTLWPGGGVAPQARKVTFAPEQLGTGGSDTLIQIGPGRLGRVDAAGSIDGAAWELDYGGAGEPFPYLPRPWMYRAPVPRTKAVSLAPLATFRGRVTVGEHTLAVEDWPGMVGHNWGAEHAERWVWLHGAGFAAAPDAWFDVTIGRIKVGPVTLPWIANGGLWLDGRLHRLGGPGALRSTSVQEEPGRCRFTLPGSELTVRGEVHGDAVVAWSYSDPGGGGHYTCNCSVAALTLSVQAEGQPERSLSLPAGAAYEFGAREAPAAVPVQPFPDP